MATLRLEGLSVRLDPTNAQRGLFARAAGARRYCFNVAVAAIRDNHAQWSAEVAAAVPRPERVRPSSAQDLERRWRDSRPDWAGEVSSWVFSWACRDAAQAHRNFLAGRARFPRFAKKGRSRDRFTFAGRDVILDAGVVTLPKLGRVRIASACPAQAKLRRLLCRGRARLTSATVSRHADGSWWLSLKIERQLNNRPEHPRPDAPAVGVDRGITAAAVAATATGEMVRTLGGGRRRRSIEAQLRRAQRRAVRRYQPSHHRREQSANWHRAQATVGRLHALAARRRADDLHGFTRALADASPVIVVETLTTKNLLANRHLSAAIADQGWGELARQLAYKATWRGGQVLHAPRFFPSSKTCAACGSVKPKLSLGERTYRCATCGHVTDRDVNAAATLAAWGEHTLGHCPCVTQARNPNPSGRSGPTRFHACGGWMTADPAPAGCGAVR
ncbi:MAG TPA: transposase [Acidimicrobiia bacterium]|jgi:putative transposase